MSQISNMGSQRDGAGASFMEVLNKLFGEPKWMSRQDDLLNNARSLDRSQVDHYLYLLVPSFVDQTLVRENYSFCGCGNIFLSQCKLGVTSLKQVKQLVSRYQTSFGSPAICVRFMLSKDPKSKKVYFRREMLETTLFAIVSI